MKALPVDRNDRLHAAKLRIVRRLELRHLCELDGILVALANRVDRIAEDSAQPRALGLLRDDVRSDEHLATGPGQRLETAARLAHRHEDIVNRDLDGRHRRVERAL